MKNQWKKGLAILLMLTMLVQAVPLTAMAGNEDTPEKILAGMTLEDKVSQMMVVSLRGWTAEDGTAQPLAELNDTVRGYLAYRHVGGVVVFAENCKEAGKTIRLISDMQTANRAGGNRIPLLVCADQEGGRVARLGDGTTGPGNMALAATANPDNARVMGQITGQELSLLGINTDLAPVVDVNDNPANPVIGTRSFGDDPMKVAAYGSAFMLGLHQENVMSVLKHFPGHGNTDTDSHTGLPMVDRNLAQLSVNELIPFKAAIDNGAEMVMTAHIQYPQIETGTYTSISTGEQIYLPATMSKTILTDILRGQMGFEGVIMSDALEMDAISKNFSTDDTLILTINAGVNILLPQAVYSAEDLAKVDAMIERTVQLVREGKIDPARIDDSVLRILRMKEKSGLLSQTDFAATPEKVAAAEAGVGSEAHRKAAWDIMAEALTVYKNENQAYPVQVKENEKVLLLFTGSAYVGAGAYAEQNLKQNGFVPENAVFMNMVVSKDTEADCLAAAGAADHVVVISNVQSAGAMDPSKDAGYPMVIANRVIEQCHQKGQTVCVISSQLPYDVAVYANADAILLAYGSGAMRTVPPASGAGSAFAPNLPAALGAVFGAVEVSGSLPVKAAE
ncbi:MAG: glycoside hydrolase family 3 protein [Lachnospiraceae bacterium]|nr:glycoside hydrolase family 3 protein [Lachnospiraceae bacterium]